MDRHDVIMTPDTTRLPTHRLRLFLRDFREIEANISLPDGQSLTQYFASRKQYVNLRDAKWTGSAQNVRHAVLKIDQVLWAISLDPEIVLSTASPAAGPREIEVQVDGGLLLRAHLYSGEGQRLSDYLESQPQFIPLHKAQLLRSGRRRKEVNVELGDVVLNQSAVLAIWEID
jgi:hypothetical protein